MSVTDFMNLRNALLILGSLVGVCLFTTALLKGYDSSRGRSEYRFSQIFVMAFIGIMMIQLSSYMDMTSRTVFGTNSYTLQASDPWTVSGNIQGVLQQLNLAVEDTQQISKAFAIMVQIIKLIGLAVFMRGLVLWYALAAGTTKHTPGTIIMITIGGAALWNIGIVITLISGALGHQITI